MVFVLRFAVAVVTATTLSRRPFAAIRRAGLDSRTFVRFVLPAPTEKRARPSVSFLLAARTSLILPTQLPLTVLGHGIGTTTNLPRLTTSVRTRSLTPRKRASVVSDRSPGAQKRASVSSSPSSSSGGSGRAKW